MSRPVFHVLSALSSGALYAFANVGFGVWQLAFVCFIPLLFALEQGALKSQRYLLNSILLGSLSGLMVYGVGYTWLLALAEGFIGGSSTTSMAMWGGYGLVIVFHFAVLAGVYSGLRKLGVAIPLAITLSLLLCETFQLNLFPFYIGAALIHAPYLAQAAELSGVYGLSAILALFNGVLVSAFLCLDTHKIRSAFLIICLTIIAAFLYYYGWFSERAEKSLLAQTSQQDELRVGLVQSNVYGLSRDNTRFKAHAHHLDMSRELVDNLELDLLVWPEAAYGNGIRGELPLDGGLIQQDLGVPVLFGATRYLTQNGQSRSSNSVFLVNEYGRIEDAYSKTKLIPFSEYLPLESWLAPFSDEIEDLFPEHQNFVAGDSLKGVRLYGRSISTPICYEAVMPDLVRDMINASDASLIVSVANDSWFGNSREPLIHLSMARLRAIEHRKWFVRVANGGISAVISPSGKLVNTIPLGEENVRAAKVYWRAEQTPFALYGNWALVLVSTLAVLQLGFHYYHSRHRQKFASRFSSS